MVERGIGKVEFLALWPQVEEQLRKGYPVKSVYCNFQGRGLLSITRRHFLRLVRAHQKPSFSPLKSLTPSPQPPRRRLTEPRADSSPSKPQTFQHDPRPSKDYFAKGAGS